jgi:FkbM family methyltransferase
MVAPSRTLTVRLAKGLFRRAGFHVKRLRGLPFGIDLGLDLIRCGLVNSSGTIVVDVGANRGDWTVDLLERLPDVTVYGFEPVPATFAHLRARIANRPRVHIVNQALGAANETKKIFLYEEDALSSFVPASNVGHAPRATASMEMVRLDDFAREAGIQHIHLLKVDTEGFELDVLRGSEGLLDRGAIDLVLAECDFHAVKQPHARFRDLHAFVERKGYMFVTLYTEYADDEVGFGFGSALFKRRTTCRATATASNLSLTTCHPERRPFKSSGT